MRPMDDNTRNALTGSRAGDGLIVYAWYDGELAQPDPLPLSAWSLSWDATRQIQTFQLDVTDPDGVYAPWLIDDMLGTGGTRLQVLYQVGGAGVVNMGWYRITSANPKERWVSYLLKSPGTLQTDSTTTPGTDIVLLSGGATVPLEADDLTKVISASQFIAPESAQTSSCISEITRILQDICPVVALTGVVDKPVNSELVYHNGRLNAVEDLCNRIGAHYRMNGDWQFELYPLTRQDPVWTVAGGREGALVDVDRAQKFADLYNIFVVDGKSTNYPIRSILEVTTGPLRVGGPHGSVPVFYSSTMIDSQAAADEYALMMRDTQLSAQTVDLQVTCLPHPGIQHGDWVTVVNPTVNGRPAPLNGRVKTMTLSGTGGSEGVPVDAMALTVECLYTDVQAAIGRARA